MYRVEATGLTPAPKGNHKKKPPDHIPCHLADWFIERYIGRDSDETGGGAPERPDQLSHEGIRVERNYGRRVVDADNRQQTIIYKPSN